MTAASVEPEGVRGAREAVDARFDDDGLHRALLEEASRADALIWVAKYYRAQREVPARTARAQAQLRQVEKMATALAMARLATPRDTGTTRYRGLLAVVLVLAALLGLGLVMLLRNAKTQRAARPPATDPSWVQPGPAK